MRTNGERFVAIRRENGRLEGLEWSGHWALACARAPVAGTSMGSGAFAFTSSSKRSFQEEPDPAAFFDPDDKGTTL